MIKEEYRDTSPDDFAEIYRLNARIRELEAELEKYQTEEKSNEDEVISKLSELSLTDLGEITKLSISLIYRKLRDDEGFGYYQHCLVTSMGSEAYEVSACIVDTDNGHTPGISWDATYWL